MAQMILNIPDTVVTRVVDAICTRYGYTGVNTLAAKSAFAKQWLINTLKTEVKAHEAGQAAATASTTASNDVENNINIT